MMRSARFESLPAEIHIFILKAIEDWDTLQTLIRSSPQLLHLYQSTRETVILSVLSNQISRDPLSTLLISIQLRLPREKCSPIERDQDYLFHALNDWEQNESTLLHHLRLDHARYLIQLEHSVEYFIDAFAGLSLSIIEDSLGIPHEERASSAPQTGSPSRGGLRADAASLR